MKSTPTTLSVHTAETDAKFEPASPPLAASTGSETFRQLCKSHPAVNYKTGWGCPECVREMRGLLQAARDALRSYQYGNASPDLAESVADKIAVALSPNAEITGSSPVH